MRERGHVVEKALKSVVIKRTETHTHAERERLQVIRGLDDTAEINVLMDVQASAGGRRLPGRGFIVSSPKTDVLVQVI